MVDGNRSPPYMRRGKTCEIEELQRGDIKFNTSLIHKWLPPVPVSVAVTMGGTDNQRIMVMNMTRTDGSDGMCLVSSPHGVITFATPDVAMLLGYQLKTLLKLKMENIIPPPYAAMHHKWLKVGWAATGRVRPPCMDDLEGGDYGMQKRGSQMMRAREVRVCGSWDVVWLPVGESAGRWWGEWWGGRVGSRCASHGHAGSLLRMLPCLANLYSLLMVCVRLHCVRGPTGPAHGGADGVVPQRQGGAPAGRDGRAGAGAPQDQPQGRLARLQARGADLQGHARGLLEREEHRVDGGLCRHHQQGAVHCRPCNDNEGRWCMPCSEGWQAGRVGRGTSTHRCVTVCGTCVWSRESCWWAGGGKVGGWVGG